MRDHWCLHASHSNSTAPPRSPTRERSSDPQVGQVITFVLLTDVLRDGELFDRDARGGGRWVPDASSERRAALYIPFHSPSFIEQRTAENGRPIGYASEPIQGSRWHKKPAVHRRRVAPDVGLVLICGQALDSSRSFYSWRSAVPPVARLTARLPRRSGRRLSRRRFPRNHRLPRPSATSLPLPLCPPGWTRR